MKSPLVFLSLLGLLCFSFMACQPDTGTDTGMTDEGTYTINASGGTIQIGRNSKRG